MAKKRYTMEEFGPVLAARINADHKLLKRAALGAAHRGLAEAARLTVKEGLVDRGTYLRDWVAEKTRTGAVLRNGAPYSAVLEYGRRPGAPGPPYQPIYDWVVRKLVANGEVELEEAEDVARSIQYAIHHFGTPPHFILRTVADRMKKVYLRDEALRILRRKGRA